MITPGDTVKSAKTTKHEKPHNENPTFTKDVELEKQQLKLKYIELKTELLKLQTQKELMSRKPLN